ncbi:hypothetical protein SESBI_17732 [Sesbania bispinosa]|nr:hypothetical protein SESBI_17732 [Sesbania bispinosa]
MLRVQIEIEIWRYSLKVEGGREDKSVNDKRDEKDERDLVEEDHRVQVFCFIIAAIVEILKNSCNYFRWADEEVTQEVVKEECVYVPNQQAEEFQRKKGKLKKKLAAERTKANTMAIGV